jgi:phosphatidylethanolamine/phosphatidyl-N-methylethanolamine N-methyltransferase
MPAPDTSEFEPMKRNMLFLRGLVDNPRGVASLFPSSRALARLIAAQVEPDGDGAVLELGAGTGAVTCALLERGVRASRLFLVESNEDFVRTLRKRFPGVNVRFGNALDIDGLLLDRPGSASAVVSGLPLLNFQISVRNRLIEQCLFNLAPKAPFIQLSFGWKPPVAETGKWLVRRAGATLRNLPPATVWIYSKRT